GSTAKIVIRQETMENRFILKPLPRNELNLVRFAVALDGQLDGLTGRHLGGKLADAVEVAYRLALKLRNAVANLDATRSGRPLFQQRFHEYTLVVVQQVDAQKAASSHIGLRLLAD